MLLGTLLMNLIFCVLTNSLVMQIENHIAGTIVLSNILSAAQDQVGWMQSLSATLDQHFEVCSACLAHQYLFPLTCQAEFYP